MISNNAAEGGCSGPDLLQMSITESAGYAANAARVRDMQGNDYFSKTNPDNYDGADPSLTPSYYQVDPGVAAGLFVVGTQVTLATEFKLCTVHIRYLGRYCASMQMYACNYNVLEEGSEACALVTTRTATHADAWKSWVAYDVSDEPWWVTPTYPLVGLRCAVAGTNRDNGNT